MRKLYKTIKYLILKVKLLEYKEFILVWRKEVKWKEQ